MKKTITSSFVGYMATGMIVCLALSLNAAPFIWDGDTDNNWMTGTNWNPDGAPAGLGSDTLIFSGMKQAGTFNNYPADTVFAGITFTNDYSSGKTAAFTNSGARIILGGNITTIAGTLTGTIADIITFPILLSGPRTLTIGQTGTTNLHRLIISSVIGETGGSYGLTKAGAGELALSGTNTYSGKTIINNAGRIWINTFTNINSGASSLGNPVTVADGTIDIYGRLSYTGAVSTASDRILRLTGASTFENLSPSTAAVVTLTGGITNNGNYTLVLRGNRSIEVPSLISLGSGGLSRTDPGTLTLSNPNNNFSGPLSLADGTISVDTISNGGSVSAVGTGTLITLGQVGSGDTTGRLLFTGASGGSCNRNIQILSQKGIGGGTLENNVAGQTLAFSGQVYRGGVSTGFSPLTLTGVGNGVLSGIISSNICLIKTNVGIWTLSGANTCSGTNQVNAGLLLVNGTMANTSPFIVNASGTLGGTGTIYGDVTASGTLSPADTNIGTLTVANLTLNSGRLTNDLNSVAGSSDCVAVTNLLTLNGANIITLRFPNGAAPSGVYTLMTYASKTGTGTFALDKTYANTFLTVGNTAVTITISDVLTWTGSQSGVWDTTAANWSPINYSEGKTVLFDDTGANTTSINIPTPISPNFVTVNADAKAYAIGGAGMFGSASLTKLGTNNLTLASTNTYIGATTINAGTLTLSGSISNSSVIVTTNAVFTQNASGTIGGDTTTITCQGIGTLRGANTYGGTTTVGLPGTASRLLTIYHNNALGTTNAGTIVNGGNSGAGQETVLALGANVIVTGEALTLNGASSYRALLSYTGGSGTVGMWDGNITAIASTYIRCDNAGATLRIGSSSEDTIFSTSCALALRGSGTNIISSTLSLGTTSSVWKDDTGMAIIRSTGNMWGDTTASQGILKIGCSEALPATATLAVGKGSATSAATFDVNGYTQTVARLYENHYSGGTQRITSALPATLIVSNTVASSFGVEGSVIDGQVSLVKANTGTLTLTGTNTMSGSFTIVGGTNVITSTGSLGVNCTNITITAGTLKLQSPTSLSDAAIVTIADGGGAKMELEGVEETVLWLNLGDKPKLPGRYSAAGGPGIIVDTVHFAGTGVLNVLKGYGGTIIMLR